MSIPLSMWNFHNWFEQRNIPHVFSIRSTENTILRVQLGSIPAPQQDCAVLSEAAAPSEYSCILSWTDDRIFFRDRSLFEIMDEIDYMLTLYSHWEQALKRINLTHGGLESLLALCSEMLPGPIMVHCGDKLLAVSAENPACTALWEQFCTMPLEQALRLLPPDSAAHAPYTSCSPVLINSPLYGGRQVLFVNIHSPHGRRIRIVGITETRQFSPGDISVMHCLAQAVQQNITLHEKRFSGRILRPAYFFADILRTGKADAEHTASILRQLGWHDDDKYTVFRAELCAPSDSLLMDKLYQTLRAACPAACCVLLGESVHVVCNATRSSAAEQREAILRAVPPASVIVSQSNFSAGFSTLPQLFAQAEKTLRQARLQKLSFLFAGDLIGEYIQQALRASRSIQALIHPAVFILQAHDRTQNTAYLPTLRTYLQCGENCSAAAKALDIHRSTLLTRLEHIQTLTGVSLNDPFSPPNRHKCVLSRTCGRTASKISRVMASSAPPVVSS